ncbi:PQQ-dependent sugar dehydrogenase [Halomonas sp. DWK9]|uniref:PQQ-dependent sugar dehydrogenase n=1 Tax=Halomonas sp. DWK9 TaxID=3060155 RepID=UPI00287F607E|nr:PQQ-dependent sugar dehydrogenase [Halomonas sp. DWK9]
MTQPLSVGARVLRFFIALLAGVILGSVVQTQINLAALQALGVAIPLSVRASTTGQDLIHFAPIYAAVLLPGFAMSQLAAALLVRRGTKKYRALIHTLAAVAGLWVTFWLANAFAPMPTLIAATRGPLGLAAMLATAGLAGWLLAVLTRGRVNARGAASMAVVAGALLLPVAPSVDAQPAQSTYQIDTLTEGLEHPWSLAWLPDGHMLVTERPGRLRLLSAQGETLVEALEGVPAVYASGQSGLFDVLLSPQFEQDRQLYLSYACGTASANHACLARATLEGNRLTQVEEIFRVHPAKSGDAHFGGRLAWLADNTLIMTLGDGFDNREEAQRKTSHIGGIVRLNPDGSAPRNNPFIADANALPALYSIGHRNVQGLVFDDANQRLIAHEHGPRGGDELNVITPGGNYGWPIATGGLDYTGARVSPFEEYPGMLPPALEWTPSIAPSGLALYQGALFPEWQGDLLVGSLVNREVRRVRLNEEGRAEELERLFGELDARIRDVRVGPEGAVYLLTDSPEGSLVRVTPARPE